MDSALGENNAFLDCDAQPNDFTAADLEKIMSSAELDNILNEDGGLDLNDSDLDRMINPDNISLGSNSSLDQLAKMPIMEVNDDAVEKLLGTIAKEEKIPIPEGPMSQQRMIQREEANLLDTQPDPLLDRMSRGDSSSMGSSQLMPLQSVPTLHRKSSFVMKDMTQEVDALQRIVNHSVEDNRNSMRYHLEQEEIMQQQQRHHHQQQQLQQQQQYGIDLEQEKLKLLSRLNEINQRQNSLTMSSQAAPSQVASMSGMNGISELLRQRRQQSQVPSPTKSGSSETALTSFLRKTQKGQDQTHNAQSTGASMLARNIPGAPQAASVFSDGLVPNQNNYTQGAQFQQYNQQFHEGAMNRTGMPQNMVRQMSARTLLARSDSGAQIRNSGVLPRVSNTGNANWGDMPTAKASFKTSGIISKHNLSDNNLARAGVLRSSLIKSRSKNSMSRENLRGFMRAHSRNSDDSLGGNNNMIPIKRRQNTGTKYRVGNSRSVPHLLLPTSGSRQDVSQQGYSQGSGNATSHPSSQMNAAW